MLAWIHFYSLGKAWEEGSARVLQKSLQRVCLFNPPVDLVLVEITGQFVHLCVHLQTA